ncbi:MAG: crotonase/enoyl-CoA hydratase family protein [Nitrososphaerales archaeon]
MADAPVIVERDDHVLIVSLNRPEKRNAINSEMMCHLADAWKLLDEQEEIRVAILTGNGPSFCAGMDLTEIAVISSGGPANQWIERVRSEPGLVYRAWLKTDLPTKPVVLAVEGFARAGGTEILQGTDIRVAGESAVFGITEVQRGLFPMAGSAVRLRRQISYALAAELLLCGEDITSRRAYEVGLINYVVPDGQALAKAREIAARIAKNGPLAVKALVATLHETESLREDAAYEIEQKHGFAVMASEDAKEGPRAFLEKRDPVFIGR